jgi:hypothetical protein
MAETAFPCIASLCVLIRMASNGTHEMQRLFTTVMHASPKPDGFFCNRFTEALWPSRVGSGQFATHRRAPVPKPVKRGNSGASSSRLSAGYCGIERQRATCGEQKSAGDVLSPELLQEVRRIIRCDRDFLSRTARTQLDICAVFAHLRQQIGEKSLRRPHAWDALLQLCRCRSASPPNREPPL